MLKSNTKGRFNNEYIPSLVALAILDQRSAEEKAGRRYREIVDGRIVKEKE